MLSIHGVFEDGKITLSYRSEEPLPENAEVLLTFYDDSDRLARIERKSEAGIEKSENFYQSIREHERVKAYGSITVIVDDTRHAYPLNDYSQGGLSFISDLTFKIGQKVSAGIADPANPDLVLMELEMEIRGVYEMAEFNESEYGHRFKVGCKFIDPVDEDLWHGLLQYLS
jgi:hypothetical protein